MKNKYHTVICGGGPAGMMAGIFETKPTLLLDKNQKLGKKMSISGNGRCNVTNNSSPENHINHVMSNPFFYYSAIYKHSPQSTMLFFESQGLSLQTEKDNRVFPASNKAKDVIKIMENALYNNKVDVHVEEEVLHISKVADDFTVQTDKNHYICKKVIIATGGISYPYTGSTGNGYVFAKDFGHRKTSLYPALTGIKIIENWVSVWQGISLSDVSLSLYEKDTMLTTKYGDILFTHKGLSGPAILNASRFICDRMYGEVSLHINLHPKLRANQLDEKVLEACKMNGNKEAQNGLQSFAPQRMIPKLLALSGIQKDRKLHSLTKKERASFVQTLQALTFHVKSLDSFNKAMITVGGVDTNEIDAQTMESKLVTGLFFAGEVLDLDALTGGYNIQIALSTGALAGQSIIKKTE